MLAFSSHTYRTYFCLEPSPNPS